jgi:outer membrane protein OmpA-like peptidoglycan-associated protein
VLGEFLVLKDGNVEGVSKAPTGGWPLPDATIAAAEPAVEPATTEVAAVSENATAPAKPPVAVMGLKMPAAKAPEAATEPVSTRTASLADEPAASASCNRDELYNVVGFNENSNDLTPRLMERLDQIVADIGEQKCKVLVTGYSSKQGSHATNALFAIERAQNVLAYLRQAGLKFEKVTATGGGATEQFGDTFYANRRVVISVGP